MEISARHLEPDSTTSEISGTRILRVFTGETPVPLARGGKMLFMVIERFKNRDAAAVYRRFRERGRMMPEGLKYVDSWVEENSDRCFQLMETNDPELFRDWTANWDDLVDFEIVRIITSKEASARVD